MTVRNVKKNLAGQQDLLPGVGPYNQIRRGQPVTVDGPAKSYFDLFVRSYAEAGLPVKGTFEDGCTLDTVADIAIYLATGKGYSYNGTLPYTTGVGEIPIGNPLWVAKDIEVLRSQLAGQDGDALVGVQQPFTGAVKRTQHDKNSELLSMADFISASPAVTAAITKPNSILFNNLNAFNLTVGAGGQFTTIADAITAAHRMRPLWKNGNGFCNIRLNTGFVLDQQMAFGAGVDLSWIRITSVDKTVYSNTAGFTVYNRSYYNYKYLFLFTDGAKSPVFQIQIEENRADSDVCAFVATRCSQLNFYPASGARKFYVGIHASFGAQIRAYHSGCAPDAASVATYMPAGYYVCDFSNSKYSSLQLVDGVICEMVLSKFDYCNQSNQPSVNCIYNVMANFQGSSASYCYIGWNIRDGSNVNIRDHKTMHCTYRGLTMIHTSYCDARRHDVEEALIATSGQVLEPLVEKGFFGCALGARIDGAGCLDLAGNDMRNCGVAVNADNGASVSAKGLDISNCSITGFQMQGGSVVSAPRLWGTNVAKLCEVKYGSRLTGRFLNIQTNSTFEINTRFLDLRAGSEFHFSDARIDGDVSLIAEEGSRLTLDDSFIKVRAVRSFTGAHVVLSNSTNDPAYNRAQPSSSATRDQYIISGGGTMVLNTCPNSDGSLKTYVKTKNTVSDAGIIYDAPTSGPIDVAMVGDSLTARGDWSGYFPNKVIGNFGIGGNTTSDIIARLNTVTSANPGKAFIMAGTNDLTHSVPVSTIVSNLIQIADTLAAAGVTPIVQSTIYAGGDRVSRNPNITLINNQLASKCKTKGYMYIDVNATLCPNGFLPDEMRVDDLHLTDLGYSVWVSVIQSYM